MHPNDTPTRRKVRYIHVDRGHDSPCWEWQGAESRGGYGQMTVNKKKVMAHRHFFERRYGPVPDGMQIDHLCRNRACVNPDHLEAVTCAENIRRSRVPKLTPEDVRRIQSLKGTRSGASVGREYGVFRSTINRIWRGEQWAEDVA